MANIVCKKSGTNCLVKLVGEATIGIAPKTKTFLMSLVDGDCAECRVDPTELTEIDIAFLQILASFRITMQRAGKKVIFERTPSDHPFSRFVARVGVSPEYFFSERFAYAV